MKKQVKGREENSCRAHLSLHQDRLECERSTGSGHWTDLDESLKSTVKE